MFTKSTCSHCPPVRNVHLDSSRILEAGLLSWAQTYLISEHVSFPPHVPQLTAATEKKRHFIKVDYDFKDVLTQESTPTLMFVSMELEARKSPKGWKPRLVMLALCPIRVLKTEHRKQQGHLFASLSNCAMFSKRTRGALKRLCMTGRTIILTAGYNILC